MVVVAVVAVAAVIVVVVVAVLLVVVTLAKVYWPRKRADDRTRVHTPPTKEGCYGAKLSSALPVPAGAPAHDIRRFSHIDRCFLRRQ